jgi:hypothetical protein
VGGGGAGAYLTGGDYLIEILTISRVVSQRPKSKGQRMVAILGRVAHVIAGQPNDGFHPPTLADGTLVSVVCNLDSGFARDLGRLRNILESCLGELPPEGPEMFALLDKVTAPPGAHLAGSYVRALCVRGTKANGEPKVNETFFPVSEEELTEYLGDDSAGVTGDFGGE